MMHGQKKHQVLIWFISYISVHIKINKIFTNNFDPYVPLNYKL